MVLRLSALSEVEAWSWACILWAKGRSLLLEWAFYRCVLPKRAKKSSMVAGHNIC